MKRLFGGLRIVTLTLTLFFGGLVAPPGAQAAGPDGAQAVGPGGLAADFVGRLYLNPDTLQGFVVGYLPDIVGIAGPFFNGSPGEGTAFFTFRSNVFQTTALPPPTATCSCFFARREPMRFITMLSRSATGAIPTRFERPTDRAVQKNGESGVGIHR